MDKPNTNAAHTILKDTGAIAPMRVPGAYAMIGWNCDSGQSDRDELRHETLGVSVSDKPPPRARETKPKSFETENRSKDQAPAVKRNERPLKQRALEELRQRQKFLVSKVNSPTR